MERTIKVTIEEVEKLLNSRDLDLPEIRTIQQFISLKLIETGRELEKVRRELIQQDTIHVKAERTATVTLYREEETMTGAFFGYRKPPTTQTTRNSFLYNKIDEIVEKETGRKGFIAERYLKQQEVKNAEQKLDYWKAVERSVSNMAITEATIEKNSNER